MAAAVLLFSSPLCLPCRFVERHDTKTTMQIRRVDEAELRHMLSMVEVVQ